MGRLRYNADGRLLLFEEGVPPIPTGAGGAIAAGGTGTTTQKTTRSLLDDAAGAECCCGGEVGCDLCCSTTYQNTGQQCCYGFSSSRTDGTFSISWRHRIVRVDWLRATGCGEVRFIRTDVTKTFVAEVGEVEVAKFPGPQFTGECYVDFPATARIQYIGREFDINDCTTPVVCQGDCSKTVTGRYRIGPIDVVNSVRHWLYNIMGIAQGTTIGLLAFTQAECPDIFNSNCIFDSRMRDFDIIFNPTGIVELIDQIGGATCTGWSASASAQDFDFNGEGWAEEFDFSVSFNPVVEACVTPGCTVCP